MPAGDKWQYCLDWTELQCNYLRFICPSILLSNELAVIKIKKNLNNNAKSNTAADNKSTVQR